MPSRKRNKGRERKAKKENVPPPGANNRGNTSELQRLIGNLRVIDEGCVHGISPLLDPVCRDFTLKLNNTLTNVVRNSEYHSQISKGITNFDPVGMYEKVIHSLSKEDLHLCDSKNKKEHLLTCLAAFATDTILHGQSMGACIITLVIMRVETGPSFDIGHPHVASKIRDLCSNARMESILFFAKRIPCSCLEDKYKQTKSTEKTGLCFCCTQLLREGRSCSFAVAAGSLR